MSVGSQLFQGDRERVEWAQSSGVEVFPILKWVSQVQALDRKGSAER